MDSNDKVHICYQDVANDKLKYATNRYGDWQVFVIDSSGSSYPSIAIDSNDNVHISYISYGDLVYATNSSGSWKGYLIDYGYESDGYSYNFYTSLALDSNDKPHILYIRRFEDYVYDDDDLDNDADGYDGDKSEDERGWPIEEVVHGCGCKI